VTLSVAASVDDGGLLSYQWYSNSINSNQGGTLISGATNAEFNPDTSQPSNLYYYVTVTNTNANVNGSQTALSTSNPVEIVVIHGSGAGKDDDNGNNDQKVTAIIAICVSVVVLALIAGGYCCYLILRKKEKTGA
jgi:hypothetical protein